MGILDKVQDKLSSNKNHDGTPAHNQGMVAGSQAHNPNAIPTAGGQTVGGNAEYNDPIVGNTGNNNNNNTTMGGPGGNTGYNNAGVHQTAGDKMQNALPGQHGNAHDAHGNPVDLSGPGHYTHGGGLSGSHNTHTGPDNRGMMDKAKDALSSNRTNRPDDPITGTNYDQNSRNTHAGGLTGSNDPYNTHNSNTHAGGPDNRGMMDKAKDTLSSNRTNQPDDPVTGTNYDQTNRNTHGGGITGSNDPYNNTHYQTTGSGLTGNTQSTAHNTHGTHNTHNAGPDNRGLMDKAKDALSSKRSNQPDDPVTGTNYDQKNSSGGGLTGGTTHTTHNAHNTHGTHNAGPDNRGMIDKAKDLLSSKRSNQPDDPVTGTNYDQKNAPAGGLTGNNYNQQPGVGHPSVGQPGMAQPGMGQAATEAGAYNTPGSGPAPNY